MHKTINHIERKLDYTFLTRSKYIDSVVIIQGLLEYIKGSILVETNKIVISDHRGFIINMNLLEYFQEAVSNYNTVNFKILNPNQKLHRDQFQEEIEK